MNKLSDNPATLIRDAIHDLEIQEKNPKVVIDMDRWHTATDPSYRCFICLAGAVMVERLETSLNDTLSPDDFDCDTRNKLIALNYFRQGEVIEAIATVGISDLNMMDRCIAPHSHDPYQFKTDMLRLADDIEDELNANKKEGEV